MKLSNLDVFLTWDDLMTLFDRFAPGGLDITDISPNGESIVIDGEYSKVGLSADWSVCFEPMESADGKCLVFQIESFELDYAPLFDIFTNWGRSRETNLARICAKRFGEGASAEDTQLWIDLPAFLSAKTDLDVRIGKVKQFRSDKRGLRLVIESAKRKGE
jgi:hypothetical protein